MGDICVFHFLEQPTTFSGSKSKHVCLASAIGHNLCLDRYLVTLLAEVFHLFVLCVS